MTNINFQLTFTLLLVCIFLQGAIALIWIFFKRVVENNNRLIKENIHLLEINYDAWIKVAKATPGFKKSENICVICGKKMTKELYKGKKVWMCENAHIKEIKNK